MGDAPPRPPPHGARSSALPNGNYDVFIVPPHSAGSGFLYLPSLKPNVNSFIAGFASAIFLVGIWSVVVPALKQVMGSIAPSGGLGLVILIAAVGAAFTFGRTQVDAAQDHNPPPRAAGAGAGGSTGTTPGPQPMNGGFRTHSAGFGSTSANPPGTGAASGWEKAREETRKREAERKKAEDTKKKQEETQKQSEETDKAKRAAAERQKWDQARAREREVRERETRERGTKGTSKPSAEGKKYEKPSAQSYDGESEAYAFRPYDKPRPRRNPATSSASSVSGMSESSYAPSASTARTSPPPPPTHRGPYITKDPEKIVIKAVYLFNNMFPKPVSQLISSEGSVTDGLILKITTEGLFIDDDIRGVPQREWDVKAWGIKLVETGRLDNLHVFRATLRDTDSKRYVFVIPNEQAWKLDQGLERLRKGSQVRSLGMNGIKGGEMKALLTGLGWLP